MSFAQQLKAGASFYINDAFGSMHRKHASVYALPLLFDEEHTTIGLLVEQELQTLSAVRDNPQQPLMILQGGAKIDEKIDLMRSFLGKATTIAVCPALSFAFLQARKKPIGTSYTQPHAAEIAQRFIQACKQTTTHLYEPEDYIVKKGNTYKKIKQHFQDDEQGITIGPDTVNHLCHYINRSKTVILNGVFGFLEQPATLEPFKEVIQCLARTSCTSIICGGDTAAAIIDLGLEERVSFLSTGGGAALFFLSNQQLPGLEVLHNRAET